MTSALALLTTCGTSLLTHGADPETRRWLVQIANTAAVPEPDRARFEGYVSTCGERLLQTDRAERRRVSAELNSIHAILGQYPADGVEHLLVHTDTAVGQATAGVVAAVLEGEGHPVTLQTAPGLRTDDFPSFREGLTGLTRKLTEWTTRQREQKRTLIFNLTGGFKSVNAYLQALGMLHADRCVFLFEGSPALMEIPRLPVRLAGPEEIRPHAEVFRRLAAGYAPSREAVRGIPDELLLALEGRVYLSVWGELVWEGARKVLLAEVSPALTLSERIGVAADVVGLLAQQSADMRAEVNECLDALSAHLDQGRPIGRSYALEKQTDAADPTATHSLQGPAGRWRLLGRFDQDRFVVEALTPAH